MKVVSSSFVFFGWIWMSCMLGNAFLLSSNKQATIPLLSITTTTTTTQLWNSKIEFISPLLEAGYPPTVQEYENDTLQSKPLLLYLPGFDGTLLSPFLQFPELGTEFDIIGMEVEMSDRSTYQDLRQLVIAQILDILNHNNNNNNNDDTMTREEKAWNNFLPWMNKKTSSTSSSRPIYIVGESFGGILTIEVVLELAKSYPTIFQQNLKGMILVNPATCYARSKLARVGPPIATSSNTILQYIWNLITQIVPLFTDEYSLAQLLLILQAKALPSVIDTPEREAYMGRTAFTIPQKLKFMPQSTLSWRLNEWLTEGCQDLSIRKEEVKTVLNKVQTLIIAGEGMYEICPTKVPFVILIFSSVFLNHHLCHKMNGFTMN